MSSRQYVTYEFGPFHLDVAERRLLRDGDPVPLAPKVFDTLLTLIENCGHLLEKDDLMTRLWPDTIVEEGTLARNISDLRKVLGETSEHKYIETVPKRGYRFVAAVKRPSDDALIVERHTRSRIITEEDQRPSYQTTPDSIREPETFLLPSEPKTRARTVVIAVLALGAVVLTSLWFLLARSRRDTDAPTIALKNATFTQLTDQPGPEYFPSLSPDGKSLIYASRISGNWDIYLQRVGGRNPINLTKDSPADDTQPAFSPNGERVAFRSEREGGGIYLIGATGESIIRLSDFGYSPSWSWDGEDIFVGTEKIPQPSTRPSKSQLWTINIKSGERKLIIEGDALQPNCSPHGYRIAYWSRPGRVGQRENIWTIPTGGGEAVAVTNGSTTDLNPVWSPDGKYLYFSSTRGGSMNIWRVAIDEKSGATLGAPEAVTSIGATTSPLHLNFSSDGRHLVYVANEEIRNLRRVAFDPSARKAVGEPVSITRGSMQLWFPDPSPDGQWLTCYSMGNQRHIFIIRTDGTDLRDLTDDANRYFWPRWSPDGKSIAFSSRRTGNYELWIINRDGSGLRQLTQGHESPGAHYSPWSPDGARIAYSVHAPKNDCVIFEPGKAWDEQKLEYLVPLSDSSIAFEGWSWSLDGKRLAGIKHLPSGVHSGIGIYDLESKKYDWLTDFGDWPLWLHDNRHLLFVSQGKILLLDTETGKYQQVVSVTNEDVDIGSAGLSRDNRTIYFAYVAAEADIWLITLE
jgi:Tol biopolymer transport system component/DNA-binding winged helix-turn-helix (wHTH) protein